VLTDDRSATTPRHDSIPAATVVKIVIAPDSFKESLGAAEVAAALAAGIGAVLPDAALEQVPMADGGEGTVDALVSATGGRFCNARVTGPRGEAVNARYGILGDGRTAVIEMAAASGLALVPPTARDPAHTTSFGTGELIRLACSITGGDIQALIIGLGGSATVDGGAGLCQALGARFFDRHGNLLNAPLTGGMLTEIADIDFTALDRCLHGVRIDIACDVDNRLLGAQGAAAVFGPQKGATPAQVDRLDSALAHLYDLIEARRGCRVRDTPGAGAAGGVGAAALAVLGARLRPGIAIVIEAVNLAARIATADLVVTGEGRLDLQTLHGKAPQGVARLARSLGVPVIGVGGSIAPAAEAALSEIFDALEACVTTPQSLAEALSAATFNLERVGRRIGRWLQLRRRLAAC